MICIRLQHYTHPTRIPCDALLKDRTSHDRLGMCSVHGQVTPSASRFLAFLLSFFPSFHPSLSRPAQLSSATLASCSSAANFSSHRIPHIVRTFRRARTHNIHMHLPLHPPTGTIHPSPGRTKSKLRVHEPDLIPPSPGLPPHGLIRSYFIEPARADRARGGGVAGGATTPNQVLTTCMHAWSPKVRYKGATGIARGL